MVLWWLQDKRAMVKGLVGPAPACSIVWSDDLKSQAHYIPNLSPESAHEEISPFLETFKRIDKMFTCHGRKVILYLHSTY